MILDASAHEARAHRGSMQGPLELGQHTTGNGDNWADTLLGMGTIGQIHDWEWGQWGKYTTGNGDNWVNTRLGMGTIRQIHDWERRQLGKYTTGNGDNWANT